MTKSEAGKLGQQALRAKLKDGYNDHMSRIGKLGFQAVILALVERQEIPANYPGNPFRNLLRNLKNGKGNNGSHAT